MPSGTHLVDDSRARGTILPVWWSALPLLLLAAALVAPMLGSAVYDSDEAATMIAAGAFHLGPYTPSEAAAVSAARWPDQGIGHVIVHSQWGQIAGWSELAARALPWLGGLLTLAWLQRLGRELFPPPVALAAALLLTGSVLFLSYMHNVRPYGAGMLCTTLTLWAWWRVAWRPAPPRRRDSVALVIGATGLLYTHYFCALLLPALALFHLLFVKQERRWWRPLWLLSLAGLLALPQAPVLLDGILRNPARAALPEPALDMPHALSLLLRYLGNGLVVIRQPLDVALVITLPLALAACAWMCRRDGRPSASAYLALVSALLLLLLLAANEWLQVLGTGRVRYFAALWPPAMLLISVMLVHPTRSLLRRPLGHALLALIVITGVSDFLRSGELVTHAWHWRATPLTVAAAHDIMAQAGGNNLLVYDKRLFRHERTFELYSNAWGERRLRLTETTVPEELLAQAHPYDALLLALRVEKEAELHLHTHLAQLTQAGWQQERASREDGVTLIRLRSPFGPARLQYAQAGTLHPLDRLHPDDAGTLRFQASLRGINEGVPQTLSLAVHIIDPASGKHVAQGDVGVAGGQDALLRSNIDISALPPGDYDVRVALYDWRTGSRLPARDLVTNQEGDMHTLFRFRTG